MRVLATILTATLLSICANAKVWSVRDFGAKGDGQTKDTEAIQAAIDAAHAEGGGTVLLTPGTYLSGSIWLKDNINFHLEVGATLKGSPDLDDYCSADCCPQNYFISVVFFHQILPWSRVQHCAF